MHVYNVYGTLGVVYNELIIFLQSVYSLFWIKIWQENMKEHSLFFFFV